MPALFEDLGYALRTLGRNITFAVTAITTLALGIGLNTAMFSIVNGVLLRPLPYILPERIVALCETDAHGQQIGVSAQDFNDWKAQNHPFSELAAYYSGRFSISFAGKPSLVIGAAVTRDFFSVFRVHPMRGTAFALTGHAGTTAVISERLWKSALGGEESVIGKVIKVIDAPYTIVGIVPNTLDFPNSADIWISLDPSTDQSDRSAHKYKVVARLADGKPLELARTEMSDIARRLQTVYPQSNKHIDATVIPLRDFLTRDSRKSLLLLLLLVSFVFLLAMANVANLLLLHSAYRCKEFAIRAALGATRSRITRYLLTEAALLALIGAAVGMFISVWMAHAALDTIPSALMRILPSQEPRLEPTVFLFGIISSLAAALFLAIPGVGWIARQEISTVLRTSGRIDPASQQLRNLLVIAQIAVGLALLITAGLTSKSFLKLQAEDLGFDPHHADVVDVVLPRGYFDDPVHAGRFYAEVLDRLRQVGIFSSVAAMDDVPLTGEGSKGGFLVKEIPADSPSHWPTAGWHLVSDEYFRTMHIPVLRGRAFLGQGHEAPNVAIVNESLAEQFWSIPDAAGQELAIPGLDDSTYASYRAGKTIWLTIVGVVANVRHNAPGTPAEPEIYLPFFQHPAGTGRLSFVVRTHVAPTNVESRIRTEISSIESQAVVQLTPYDTILQRAVQLPRLRYLLVGIFAGLALLLSALGIYGVVAHAVAQRRHEFAIRTALGARPRHILASALSVGVRLIVIGTPLGVLCGIGGAQLIRSFLYGVGTTDISTLFGSALLLSSITGLTSYLAARQATRVEAAAFLHSE